VAEAQAAKLQKAARKKPIVLSAVGHIAVDKVLQRLVRILNEESDSDSDEDAQSAGEQSRWSPLT
jgi:hypothetical protein